MDLCHLAGFDISLYILFATPLLAEMLGEVAFMLCFYMPALVWKMLSLILLAEHLYYCCILFFVWFLVGRITCCHNVTFFVQTGGKGSTFWKWQYVHR